MNYTYIVECADGTFYTGWTSAKYTKSRRPVKLIYYEGFQTKEEAMRREYCIKQLTRAEKEELVNWPEDSDNRAAESIRKPGISL